MSHTVDILVSKLRGFLSSPCVSYASTSNSNMQSGQVNQDIEPNRVLGSQGQEMLLKILDRGMLWPELPHIMRNQGPLLVFLV